MLGLLLTTSEQTGASRHRESVLGVCAYRVPCGSSSDGLGATALALLMRRQPTP